VLVGVWTEGTVEDAENSLAELKALAETAGSEVLDALVQRRQKPDPATFIGRGKVEELRDAVLATGADTVICDGELAPSQLRNLEDRVKVKVVDRVALILDIFAQHATTRAGKLQVELAQLKYALPRLGLKDDSLSRLTGGIGGRGPGETKLEIGRRRARERVSHLEGRLKRLSAERQQRRKRRARAGIPIVSIVGYTNAGKSTLLNTIAQADVLAEDKLFATLDPTTRRVVLPSDRVVLFSDTVGFIQKLPTQLIAAFRSTLEEVVEADLLLHVVDLSHLNMEEQIIAVEEVLEELGAGSKPVVMALNKVDRFDLDDPADARLVAAAQADYPGAVVISAEQSWGIDVLLDAIDAQLRHHMAPVDVLIPYSRGELVSYIHEHGIVEQEEHTGDGTHVVGRLPVEMAGRFAPFWYQEAAT